MSPTRREVLRAGALAGAALALEILPGGRIVRLAAAAERAAEAARGAARLAPNPWLAVDADGKVTIVVARGEMGQGVRTSLAMLVAEELECDWRDVRVVNAEPGPRYPRMRTSGSWSVGGGWVPLRRAGAAARDMLVRAAAARWGASAAECRAEAGAVIHGPSGRRLAFGALVAAASALEPPENPTLGPPEAFTLVGKPMKRLDGPAIVTGAATYGVDVRVPGMRFASLERGPHLGAKVRGFDRAAARAVPGVRQVVQVPSGIAVVADDSWAAQRGREALKVDWTPGPEAGFDSRAFLAGLVESSREPGFEARVEGDVATALAGAAQRLESVYEYGFQVHVPLEPMNATAAISPDGGCEIWIGTQAANQVQEAAAARLGVPLERVRVHLQLMGGGFGRRLGVDMALEAVEVARAIGSPVQVLWSRSDDLRYGYFQPGSVQRMLGGIDGRGNVVAWKHTMAGVPHSAFSDPGPGSVDLARDLMWGGYDNPYVIPNMRVAHVTIKPPVPTGPWRAVHYPPGVLARECFLDELAAAGRRDPLELRLALLDDARDPNRPRLARVLRAAAERAGWGSALAPGHGLGLAANVYDGGTVLAQIAEVSVTREGVRVHRMVCALDCGRVVNPLGLEGQVESAIVWGLTAAIKSEITFARGIAEQSSYADYPVLAMGETPRIEVHVVPGDGPPLGIGEQCVSPVAAAVHNAVFAASGRRLRRSPLLARDLG